VRQGEEIGADKAADCCAFPMWAGLHWTAPGGAPAPGDRRPPLPRP